MNEFTYSLPNPMRYDYIYIFMNEEYGPEKPSNLPEATWPNALVHPPY